MSSDFVTAPLAGSTVGTPGGNLVLTEVLDPGGTEPPTYIAPVHVHHSDDEAWYILEGELALRLDGDDVLVPLAVRSSSRRAPSTPSGNPLAGADPLSARHERDQPPPRRGPAPTRRPKRHGRPVPRA